MGLFPQYWIAVHKQLTKAIFSTVIFLMWVYSITF